MSARSIQLALIALGVFLVTSIYAPPVAADVITIEAVYKGNKKTVPVVDIKIKDKDGAVITVEGMIDTGNANTTTINSKLATRLGVTATGEGQHKTGGGTVTVKTGSLAGKDGVVPGNDGKSVPLPDRVAINDNIPDNVMILGGEFLDQFGDWDFKKKKKKVVLTKDDQVVDLNLRLQTDLTARLAQGTLVDPDRFGVGYTVDVSLFSASDFVVEPFIVSSWYQSSLISLPVAAALGLDASTLPSAGVQTYAGQIFVPSATIAVRVFASEPLMPLTVGILSALQNPLDQNILGGDFLSGFDEFDFNVLFGRFEAEAVPEPSTLVLLAAGLAAVAARRKRSRGRGASDRCE